jgi:predicted DNA-binding protein (MmcQ/YjbR family)
MTLEELRDYCLSKPAVQESMPFGPDTLVFKVTGRIFLITGFDSEPLRFNVKCDPDKAIELREMYHCVLPGYHMNKKHWNTIVLDGSVPTSLVRSWIDHSYELIYTPPKKAVASKKISTKKVASKKTGKQVTKAKTKTPARKVAAKKVKKKK